MFRGNINWFCSKKDEKYYPQVFLKEWNYTEIEKMVIRYIAADLKFSFDD